MSRDMTIIARIEHTILASPPWAGRVEVGEGEVVLARSADNLPEDSPIKWWIRPLPGAELQSWHVFAQGSYGIGAGRDDLKILADISRFPSIALQKDLSNSSWVAANQSACHWFLQNRAGLKALIESVRQLGEGEE